MPNITPEAFEAVAREVLTRTNGRKEQLSAASEKDNWAAFFGTSPIVAADLWNRIDPVVNVDRYAQPKHLLYGLVLMKKYCGDKAHGQIVKCHFNTFAKWAWVFIEAIHDLHHDVIRFENRNDGHDPTITNARTAEDCSDFPIMEPHPFDRTWWSHKINGPALKYEATTSITKGYIVHWSGPHKPSVADITIFREHLLPKLEPGECVESDNGCSGEDVLKTPQIAKSRVGRAQKSKVRARQENIFGRVKIFHAFVKPFTHSHEKHKWAVGAALVVVQLGLEHGTLRHWNLEYTNEYF